MLKPVRKIREKIISPIREFICDSRAVGIVLLVCTVISLVISNSGWGAGYIQFWDRELNMPIPELQFPHTILHVVNDALMAFFFLLVGLEIKRELLVGELANFKKALLPLIAALGGMVMPAFLYYLWCGGTQFSVGWGIPMATDIAFSLGILSLLGKRIPVSFRIFLTALAIIDDLGGILTMAIFYASEIKFMYLFIGAIILFILTLMNLFKIQRHYLYFMLGATLWYVVLNSGIHATIAGVLLAFTIPLYRIEALEHALHDPVRFIILPLFALSNTAILLPSSYTEVLASPVVYGILFGLILGKPLGIFLFSWLAVKLKITSMPHRMSFPQLIGIGLIAGIGFTMSIFIATLAFKDPEAITTAKVAIIIASAIAGTCGFVYLRFLRTKKKQPELQAAS